MKRYTVVLQTPEYLAEQYGEQHTIVFVEGEGLNQAASIARGIATIKAKEDPDEDIDPDDFQVVAIFEGWHQPCTFWE